MKKSEIKENQTDLFPVEPKILGLGIMQQKLSGADLKIEVQGVVNVNGLEKLTVETYQAAWAMWLLEMCQGDIDMATRELKKAYIDFINREMESHRETPEPVNSGLIDFATGKPVYRDTTPPEAA